MPIPSRSIENIRNLLFRSVLLTWIRRDGPLEFCSLFEVIPLPILCQQLLIPMRSSLDVPLSFDVPLAVASIDLDLVAISEPKGAVTLESTRRNMFVKANLLLELFRNCVSASNFKSSKSGV